MFMRFPPKCSLSSYVARSKEYVVSREKLLFKDLRHQICALPIFADSFLI
jgi:hypothetical protein